MLETVAVILAALSLADCYQMIRRRQFPLSVFRLLEAALGVVIVLISSKVKQSEFYTVIILSFMLTNCAEIIIRFTLGDTVKKFITHRKGGKH